MIELRPYQAEAEQAIYADWQRVRNVLAVLPTGAGKTVLFSKILADTHGPSVAVAHRQELVSQISLALARNEVRHRIIAPDSVRGSIEALHMIELGRRWVDQQAPCGVAGVDTLNRMTGAHFDAWRNSVQRWVMDEAHHVLRDNKWGKACELFPSAYGLGVTATPVRADGRGLGQHADGLMDSMIVGPSMRDLIEAGYLTDYRIFAPKSDLDLSAVKVGDSGDYVGAQLRAAVHKSHITGDVVEHYLRLASGKLGVTFAVDIEAATEIAAAFRARGVPAEVVTSKTPDTQRVAILRRFRRREVLQLVNVDLFGEGFDLPAIEVVSMARPTQSYALFGQQFGRALRLMIEKALAKRWDTFSDSQRRDFIAASQKPVAIIIDHVGNVFRHGLPDAARSWSLDRREKRARGANDAMPTTVCSNTDPVCAQTYERFHPRCPFCGFAPEPAGRSAPEQVDGDLQELDAAVLAALRGEADRVVGAPRIAPGANAAAIRHAHMERLRAQVALRGVMQMWGGWREALGESLSQAQRRFYLTFGVDVMSAQALGAREAGELMARVDAAMDGKVVPIRTDGIVDAQRWLAS